MAKVKNDYFKLTEQQVEFCVNASELLSDIICNYSVDTIAEQRAKMHDIEHAADDLHHDILTRLYAEFITPIDQEDILRLVQIIDDITDAIDEVVQEFYIFHMETMPAHAAEMSKIVCRCVAALHEAMKELKNFKKPDALRKLVTQVNTIEGEADAAYNDAIYDLFATETDARTLISSKGIYESLENCCDLCEHAGDIIEQVIIKNT